MPEYFYEIRLDHMMDDRYIDMEIAAAKRSLAVKLSESLKTDAHIVVSLREELPPSNWREIYGDDPFLQRTEFKYKYYLEISDVKYRDVVIARNEMIDFVSKTIESIGYTDTSILVNEIIKRIKSFRFFCAIEKWHENDVRRFEEWFSFEVQQ